MKKLFPFLLCLSAWGTPQQATIGIPNKGLISIPSASPFTTLGCSYQDWRPIIGTGDGATWDGNQVAQIFGFYQIVPYVAVAGVSYRLEVLDTTHGHSVGLVNTIPYGTDQVFRFQSCPTSFRIETWTVTGQNYEVESTTFSSIGNGISGSIQLGQPVDGSRYSFGKFAFWRIYSGSIAAGSQFPYAGGPLGDLADYEFNGNLNDSSGRALNMAVTGSITYTTAATYPPACAVSAPVGGFNPNTPTYTIPALCVALNNSNTLTFTNSLSATDHPAVANPGWWVGSAPPGTGTFSSTTVQNPVFTPTGGWGNTTASWEFAQVVCDSTPTCASPYYYKLGVVPQSANGTVVISNAIHSKILGPQTTFAVQPFSQMGPGILTNANLIINKLAGTSSYDFNMVDYWNTAGAGTVAVANTSQTITGSGTTFTTTFCQGPGSPTVPKYANSTAIAVWYPIQTAALTPATFPGSTGRRLGYVQSCTDDTHMTVTFSPSGNLAWQTTSYVGAGSGYSYAYVNINCSTLPASGSYEPNCITPWNYTSAPADFYDNVVGLYRIWWITGIDDYLQAANVYADRMFQNPFYWDKGVGFETTNAAQLNNPFLHPANRNMALTGIALRNAANPPFDYSIGLRAAANLLIGTGTPTGTWTGAFETCFDVGPTATNCGQDVREAGYALKFVADEYLANSGPNGVSPSTAQQTISLAALTRDMSNRWRQCQALDSDANPPAVAGTSDGICRQGDTISVDLVGWRSSWVPSVVGPPAQPSNGYPVKINAATGQVTASGSTFNSGDFTAPVVIASIAASTPVAGQTTLTFASSIWTYATTYPGFIGVSGATGTGCSVLNGNLPVISASGTSAVVTLNTTGCTYTGSSASGAVPTAIWFVQPHAGVGTVPISNLEGDSTFFYATYSSPTVIQLTNSAGVAVPYTGSMTCTSTIYTCDWQLVSASYASANANGVPSWLAYPWQPYMTGILNTGLYSGSTVLAASDPTNSAAALVWIQRNAVAMNLYGIDRSLQGGLVTNGLLYGVAIGCTGNGAGTQNIAYEAYPTLDSLGQCQYQIDAARQLGWEGLNVFTTCLSVNPSSLLCRNTGLTIVAAAWASVGEIGYSGTNEISSILPPSGSCYVYVSQHKCFGQYAGQGNNTGWYATSLITPQSPSIGISVGIAQSDVGRRLRRSARSAF